MFLKASSGIYEQAAIYLLILIKTNKSLLSLPLKDLNVNTNIRLMWIWPTSQTIKQNKHVVFAALPLRPAAKTRISKFNRIMLHKLQFILSSKYLYYVLLGLYVINNTSSRLITNLALPPRVTARYSLSLCFHMKLSHTLTIKLTFSNVFKLLSKYKKIRHQK